jgi:CBS domain-containing protein
VLSNSEGLRLPLRWVAMLYGRVPVDFAITSGVHTHEDVLKAMMAGAKVAVMASELLRNGTGRIREALEEMVRWMEEREYSSIKQMIGSMSQVHVAEPSAFERANYMKTLASFRPQAPELPAFRLHNGTVWRWNRPCYGVIDGRPHLRIENRALPSGPTVLDEVANAAFFLGLVSYFAEQKLDVRPAMDFDDAKNNFYAAARYGLKAELTWLNGSSYPATGLILDQLLPLAKEGLSAAGIDAADIERYLDVIEQRVRSGRTGSRWSLSSLAAMHGAATPEIRLAALTKAMAENSRRGAPVHAWPLAETPASEEWLGNYKTIGQFMSTDLFTVRAHDIIDLVARVMDWRQVRHVPVEDDDGKLVGLISYRDVLHFFAERGSGGDAEPVPVRTIMKANPVSVTRDTSSLEAIAIMRRNNIGCLPVVDGDRLIGIVTAQDFLAPSGKLFEQYLKA